MVFSTCREPLPRDTLFLMNNIGLLIMLVAVGAIASHFAKLRGRNPRTWFILGFVFGLIGLAVLFVLPSLKKKKHPQALQQTPPASPAAPLIKKPAIEVLDATHANKLWYYLDESHQQYGPMSINALSQAWEAGKVKPHTYVWNEHLTDWKSFDQVLKPT